MSARVLCTVAGTLLALCALAPRAGVWRDSERARAQAGPAQDARPEAAAEPGPLEKSLCGLCQNSHCRSGHGMCIGRFAGEYGWADPGGADLAACTCGCCGHQCGVFDGCSPHGSGRRDAPERAPLFEHVASMGAATGFPSSHGARSIAFFARDGREYAVVAAFLDDAVYVADVSDPARPRLVSTLRDGEKGFSMLAGPTGVAIASLEGVPHALVTSLTGDGLQIIRLHNPREPTPAAAVRNGRAGFAMLAGAHSVDTAALGGRTYAVVSAYEGGGIQLIDVSRPAGPLAVASLRVPSARGVRVLTTARGAGGARAYALVAQYDDNALTVVDISSPRAPTAVATLAHGVDGLSALEGASSLATFSAAGSEYALVAAEMSSGLQLLDVSDPRAPVEAGAVRASAERFPMLEGTTSVAVASSGNCTLGVVGSYRAGGAQLLDLTQPTSPRELAQLVAATAGDGAPLPARGVVDVAMRAIRGGLYAFVVASTDNVVHVFSVNASAACSKGEPTLGEWTS